MMSGQGVTRLCHISDAYFWVVPKAFLCSVVILPGEHVRWVWGLENAELSKPHDSVLRGYLA